MHTLTRLALLLAAAGTAVGCVSTSNDQAVHADGTVFAAAIPPSDTPTYSQPDAPSVAGLDRSNWPQTQFTVVQREVEHQTLYRSRPVAYTHSSAVQRGEFPTPETAGEDVTGTSRGDQALEAVVAPLNAIAELALMIPRAFLTPPTASERGPTMPVERAPSAPAARSSGEVAATPARSGPINPPLSIPSTPLPPYSPAQSPPVTPPSPLPPPAPPVPANPSVPPANPPTSPASFPSTSPPAAPPGSVTQ